MQNLTKLSELTLEHLVAKAVNMEKLVGHKESLILENVDERDMEYVKQSVLSEIKKIDMARLRTYRYSEHTPSEDENFSLAVSQYLYKIDNLSQKYVASMAKIKESLTSLNEGPSLHIDQLSSEK